MKPTVVADEMFPEGAGPFMELDEVKTIFAINIENKILNFNKEKVRLQFN